MTSSEHTDILYVDCVVATMQKGQPNYGLIEGAGIAVSGGRVQWVGLVKEVPRAFVGYAKESLNGKLVTPALIDCHTHLVFGGNRAGEFELRLKGASYEEISRQGGGIVSTVNATRAASEDQLFETALMRLDSLLSEGVAVVEIKSGYGLTVKDEIRMLKVARQLEQSRKVKIVTTWLAAHAIPKEYAGRSDQYIDDVVIAGLHEAAAKGLVDAVDAFCEDIAFSNEQVERVFKEARTLGLPVKLHAEQLTNQEGALLVARYEGLSADHLEYLADKDVSTFARSGAVAVLLPGAYYTLNESQKPPIDTLRAQGVDIAVATDCNPGSSPISSLLTAMNMACNQFALTPEEALAGATRCAASALGLSEDYGTIESGKKADFCLWNVEHPAELTYWVGGNPLTRRIHF
ncbi:imidazolonepropionase [Arenicella sp. 4NH20-0111]|uniref:imidazolonepropionase n=1 Tax=Arenicella sp. 4NH20-0111 TaxID=3127648 RepID=UPI003102A662